AHRPTLSKWVKTRLIVRALLAPIGSFRFSVALKSPSRDDRLCPKQPFETPPKEGGSSGRTEKVLLMDNKAVRAEEAPSSQGPSRSHDWGSTAAVDRAATASGVRQDYAYCREVTRRSSSNFAYAFHLLAPERRDALYAVYAFCRFLDDIADEAGCRTPAILL